MNTRYGLCILLLSAFLLAPLMALAATPFVHETVDATGSVGSWTSLVLDAQGNPHISYLDFSSFDLKHAVKTGGTWTTETVDATGSVAVRERTTLVRLSIVILFRKRIRFLRSRRRLHS